MVQHIKKHPFEAVIIIILILLAFALVIGGLAFINWIFTPENCKI